MSARKEGEGDAWCGEAGHTSPAPPAIDETKEEGDPSEGKSSQYHPRRLTAASALEIFKLRPEPKGLKQLRRGAMTQCKAIAPQFGVSPKTVREIWAGRAWTHATRMEWTEAEVATRASSFSRMMHDDSAGSATSNDAVADSPLHSCSIPALQHSTPGALGPFAPRNQQQAPTLQAAPLLGLNNGAAPSLQALLPAAHSQPADPQAHTISAAQLLAQFAGFQTAPLHIAWGSGAHTGAATQL
ncbi:hypothetical protein T484DRAFT_1860208, partial [Baffinella frigidus]